MFNDSKGTSHINTAGIDNYEDVNRGLALLILISLTVVGSSWLFSLPVYFDLQIATQIIPVVFAVIFLFLVFKLQNRILNIIAIPAAFILAFSSWSFAVYFNFVSIPENIKTQAAAQMLGLSNGMYVLGMCVLIFWLQRFFKFAVYLSSVALITLIAMLFVFAKSEISTLLALFLALSSCVALSFIGFRQSMQSTEPRFDSGLEGGFDDDLLLPSEVEEEQEIAPELAINTLPLNEAAVTHDWESILKELFTELKNTADVDQLFKSMLLFLHGAIEYDAAAVGMLQEKSLKKIVVYGDDEFVHSKSLNWTNQRIKELFASKEPKLSTQNNLSGSGSKVTEPLNRLDVPVIANSKVVGIVTLFRKTILFDTHDVKLVSAIVFYSMIALKTARLQEEVKRLSSDEPSAKLTLYSREQFVAKTKPILDKLGKPRECSMFVAELDNLDFVIDTVGREAGIKLYKAVSKVIMSHLTEADLIGKYGKEGFIVMLDETNMNQAKEKAESIRKKVSDLKLKYQEHVLNTTLSIGLTIVSDPKDDLPTLLRKTDMGLFVAKENGSNTVKVSL